MKPTKNPFSETPTKVQLEQEQKMDQVRACLLGVLQNYVSVEDDDDLEEDTMMLYGDGESDNSVTGNTTSKRRPTPLGPLNVQGCIDHRLSIADVISKSDNDCNHGSWDKLSKSLREIQNLHSMGRNAASGSGGSSDNFLASQQYVAHNVNSSVPPEIHAAVALNAMMEKYTSGFHNSFF